MLVSGRVVANHRKGCLFPIAASWFLKRVAWKAILIAHVGFSWHLLVIPPLLALCSPWCLCMMLFGDITSSVVALGIECFMLFNWCFQHGNLTNKPAKPRPAKLRWSILPWEALNALSLVGWRAGNVQTTTTATLGESSRHLLPTKCLTRKVPLSVRFIL